MKRIRFKLITFDEGVALLQASKVCKVMDHDVDGPYNLEFTDYKYAPHERWNEMHLLDNGKVLMLASDWNSGPYHEVDGEDPIWFVGDIIEE